MKQTAELTNFNIVTPPDFYDTESLKIGIFGFSPNDFYRFLNSVPLKEQMVIYTIPDINAKFKGDYFPWIKRVIGVSDCVFLNNDNKKMVISKTDNYKNVYMIDNKFDTIEKIVRLHGKKY